MGFIGAFTPFIEIFVIAIIINYLLSFFWNTRSMDLLFGAMAFLIIFAITSLFHLPILYTIMTNLVNVAAIAILVIFQPELRVALSKLSLKGKRYREVTEFDKFLDQLTNSVYKLADKRIGALIALEHEDKLDEFAQKAVLVNGKFSSELLETIFASSTPLHDGAVIIRDTTIVAAAVILPLAEESADVPKSTGTRHRAALGISQTTDALVIAISEESGKISLAREGRITQGLRADRFKGIIRSVFTASETRSKKSKFNILEWFGA
jgi:diadenylate cyclase